MPTAESLLVGYPELPTVTFDKNYVEEQMVSLYFQLNRKTDVTIDDLSTLVKRLLDYLVLFSKETKDYLILMYRMIGQTRDCYFHGKGEQLVSYMMIYEWYSFSPELAFYAIRSFVVGKFPYGSWRDIKYLCQYVRSRSNENHLIIQFCVRLMNEHLHNDSIEYNNMSEGEGDFDKKRLTCVAKWIPRENKRFHWLFNLLVLDWFSTYQTMILSKCEYESIRYFAAISKCKRIYRQMVSSINKRLDTLENLLCSKEYNKIKPPTIPQIAFMKHKNLLLNHTTACAQNISTHFYLKHFPNDFGIYDDPPERILLSHIPISYYVTEAFKLVSGKEIGNPDSCIRTKEDTIPRLDISKRELLNKQWAQMSNHIGMKKLHGLIPLLDMSERMYGENLNTAIGVACLIAERTTFGKKIMVYDNQPTWINLDQCRDGDFVSMIECLYHSTRGTTKTRSNVLSAVHLLLDAFVSSNESDINIGLLKLVFLSNHYNVFQPLIIKHVFTNQSKPCPILVHWNFFSGVFPDIKVKPGCFFFSGDSIYPLQVLDNHPNATPFEVVQKVLKHRRYNKLEEFATSVMG